MKSLPIWIAGFIGGIAVGAMVAMIVVERRIEAHEMKVWSDAQKIQEKVARESQQETICIKYCRDSASVFYPRADGNCYPDDAPKCEVSDYEL